MKLVDVILRRVTPSNVEFWARRNGWTPRAQFVVSDAIELAKGLEHKCIYPESIILGIIALGHGVAFSVLKRKTDVKLLSEKLREFSSRRPGTQSDISFSPEAKAILSHLAKRESARLSHGYIGTEHLLLALLSQGGDVANLISEFGVSYQNTLIEVKNALNPNETKS